MICNQRAPFSPADIQFIIDSRHSFYVVVADRFGKCGAQRIHCRLPPLLNVERSPNEYPFRISNVIRCCVENLLIFFTHSLSLFPSSSFSFSLIYLFEIPISPKLTITHVIIKMQPSKRQLIFSAGNDVCIWSVSSIYLSMVVKILPFSDSTILNLIFIVYVSL